MANHKSVGSTKGRIFFLLERNGGNLNQESMKGLHPQGQVARVGGRGWRYGERTKIYNG